MACGGPNYPTEAIGARPGEKLHETLVSADEMRRAVELDDHFIVCPAGSKREGEHPAPADYTSSGTIRLTADEVRSMLVRAGLL
jgi:UDP-N-acetylglucosamine 4,6-dehydratase